MEENLYEVLGVDEKAEIEVIKAAHRALAKKYHPDTYAGDKKTAEERLKKVNAAFDVLSDPKKRAQYDEKLRKSSSSSNFGDDEDFSSGDFGEAVLQEDWAVVVEVYPETEYIRKQLHVYSPKLSFRYQILILSSKSAAKASKVGDALKKEFLTKYFGSNKKMHDFVEVLLFSGKRKIASEINKKIAILGSDASQRVISDIKKKFEKDLSDLVFSSPETFQEHQRRKKQEFEREQQRRADQEKWEAGAKKKQEAYKQANKKRQKSKSKPADETIYKYKQPYGPVFFLMCGFLLLILATFVLVSLANN